MIEHFIGPAIGIVLALWSAFLSHTHDFPVPPPSASSAAGAPTVVIESPGMGTTTPFPLDVIRDEIQKLASTSVATTTKPAPVAPKGPVAVTPSTPFEPLPVPTPPAITPTSPANPAPSPTPATPPVPAVPIDTELVGEALLKGAVVNIICLPGGGLPGSSGSGIVVDPRGLILTVAHVGQGFLLRDYPTKGAGTCYIRTGSPAKNAYSADLVYISPTWIAENKATFLESSPTGTGENDFAFLAVTGSISAAALPSPFIFIPLSPAGTKVAIGDTVGTGSYAAEFLTSSQIRSALYPTVKFALVNDFFTFGKTTEDIFSVAAGSAAQEGSSGGAVINAENELVGLISTRSVKPNLSDRTLQALTMDHIRRSFRSDTGADLDSYLKGDLGTLVAKERPEAAALEKELAEEIEAAQ